MVVGLPVKEAVVGENDDTVVPGIAQFSDRLHVPAKVLVGARDLQLAIVAVELVAVNGN